MKKSFSDRLSLYVAPILLMLVAFFSLALTFRSGPEFSDSPAFEVSSQPEYLADLSRLDSEAHGFISEEVQFAKTTADFGSYQALRLAIGEVAQALPIASCLIVQENGTELYTQTAPIGLRPASTQKLLTALAALEVLGEDYTFKTQVRAFREPVDGVLEGDLYLIGSGDPYLWTQDYYMFRSQRGNSITYTPLEDLANQILGLGLTQINGAVAVVENKYDDLRYPPTWPAGTQNGNVAGTLSALSVNQSYLSRSTGWVSSSNPGLSAAAVFDDLLESQNVLIPFSPFIATEQPPILLAEVESAPLKDQLSNMLRLSDNTAAELLVKEISAAQDGLGTTEAGLDVMLEILIAAGIYEAGHEIPLGDGSGVAESNRINCRQLVLLLEHAGPTSTLAVNLAVTGESGTLRNRFLETELAGKVYAKTGSWNGIASLAGYVWSEAGETLSFAYISNDLAAERLSAEERYILEEQILLAMYGYLNNMGGDPNNQ